MSYDEPLTPRDVEAIKRVLDLYRYMPGTFNTVSIVPTSPKPAEYEGHRFWPPEIVINQSQPPERTVYWSLEFRYSQPNGETHLIIPIPASLWN